MEGIKLGRYNEQADVSTKKYRNKKVSENNPTDFFLQLKFNRYIQLILRHSRR